MLFNLLATGAIAVLSWGSIASAATISYSATPAVAFANPIGTLVSGTFNQNVTDPGLVSGVRRSPWENTDLNGKVYSSITGVASYAFGGLNSIFSLVWGSPDTYNSLAFYKAGIFVWSVTGADIVGCCGSNIISKPLVTFADFGQFDRVDFASGSPAFEYANISATVPVPAAGVLLMGAFGGLAALRRRKRV